MRTTRGQKVVLALNAYINARLAFERNPEGTMEEITMADAEDALADTLDEVLE